MWGFDPSPKRRAFVLGISSYDTCPDLPNATADAQAISDQLRELHFDVVDVYDLDHDNIFHYLSDFLKGEPDEPKLDTIVVYYAGHGIQLADQNYIVPSDFDPHASDPVSHLIDVQWLLDSMAVRAEKKILFLDACRDDGGVITPRQAILASEPAPVAVAHFRDNTSAAGGAPSRSLTTGHGFARSSIANMDQTFIAFAADPGSYAQDGPRDGNSPFSSGVLRYVNRRGFDIFDMCQNVARDVRRETKGAQTPWTNSNLIDQFEFHPANNWPIVILTGLGLLAGVLSALNAFDLLRFSFADWLTLGTGVLHDVRKNACFLVTSLFLGLPLGLAAYMWAERCKRTALAFVTATAIYTGCAIVSRYFFAPIAAKDDTYKILTNLDLQAMLRILGGQVNLETQEETFLVTVVFMALIGGAFTGLGSVLSGAPFHHELRRTTRIVMGVGIGMLAAILFLAFLIARESFCDWGIYCSDTNDGQASIPEVIFITAFVAAWQGALAWNVGRAYAYPRYDDT